MSVASSPVLGLYRRLARWPLGRWLFTRVLCWRAPYFATIRPLFVTLEPGLAVARMRKRRRVQNHIGTVHAIAMANLCELVAGTMTEVTLPGAMRWIPKGMQIDYLGKATTDLVGRATLDAATDLTRARDVPVTVEVSDRDGQLVVRAVITMWVSPR